MTHTSPPVVCIIGKKKSGKTTTAVGLIQELVARGYRVMSAKHGHGFEMDTAGTDSYRHRHEGGAHRVVMAGPGQIGVMGAWGTAGEPTLEDVVARYLDDADIVVAEGFKSSSYPKIEVFRRATHERPLYGNDPALDATLLAILTDVEGFDAAIPILDVDDPRRFVQLGDMVERALLQRPEPDEAP